MATNWIGLSCCTQLLNIYIWLWKCKIFTAKFERETFINIIHTHNVEVFHLVSHSQSVCRSLAHTLFHDLSIKLCIVTKCEPKNKNYQLNTIYTLDKFRQKNNEKKRIKMKERNPFCRKPQCKIHLVRCHNWQPTIEWHTLDLLSISFFCSILVFASFPWPFSLYLPLNTQ